MTEELQVQETRKLASFRTVDGIEAIPGADAIEVAVIGGWKVVTKKGEFRVGDPCVYFEIDSFLPDGVPAWQFLVDKSPRIFNGVKGHRLRTVKLRGQISQGLILPISAFPILELVLKPELTDLDREHLRLSPESVEAEVLDLRYALHEHEAGLAPQDLNLNTLLGVVKWDPPLAPELQGQAVGLFPSFIRKTDQERAQNLKAEIFGYNDELYPFDTTGIPEAALEAMYARGELAGRNGDQFFKVRKGKADRDALYEITMKLDGSSMTAFVRGVDDNDSVEIGVCSRNLQLKINEENAGNTFVKMLTDSGLRGALEQYFAETGRAIAVQGELMGPGIQENREQLKEFEFFVYDIFDIDRQSYMGTDERLRVVADLLVLGAKIKHVPILHKAVKLQDLCLDSMDQLLAFAEGPSIKHPIREGLVYKKSDGTFSFKTISNKYLEKEKG